jgi:ketosteroid isomerase-like protein
MEQSAELKELTLRFYTALSSSDLAFVKQHFSQQEGVLVIGTDPQEWWAGHATITKVFKAQMEEMGQFTLEPGAPQAYSAGGAGWAADRPTFRFADGTAFPVRITMVFQQEDGEWKVVHMHASSGISNQDALGKTLTTE